VHAGSTGSYTYVLIAKDFNKEIIQIYILSTLVKYAQNISKNATVMEDSLFEPTYYSTPINCSAFVNNVITSKKTNVLYA